MDFFDIFFWIIIFCGIFSTLVQFVLLPFLLFMYAKRTLKALQPNIEKLKNAIRTYDTVSSDRQAALMIRGDFFEIMHKADQVVKRLPATRGQQLKQEIDQIKIRASNAGLTDLVRFCAYHLGKPSVYNWSNLAVYVYIKSAFEAVKRDADCLSQKETASIVNSASKVARLRKGTTLTLFPEGEDLIFDPPRSTIVWENDFQRSVFALKVRQQHRSGQIPGKISVFVGPLIIATVPLTIEFIDSEPVARDLTLNAKNEAATAYRRIFASYSHHDRQVVKAVDSALKSIGDELLIDCEVLRSGEKWVEGLKKLVDHSDIFQLFWSHNAVRSEEVTKEWRYALSSRPKEEGFIRPVCWQNNVPVPEELSHLHFKYLPELGRQSGSWLGRLLSRKGVAA